MWLCGLPRTPPSAIPRLRGLIRLGPGRRAPGPGGCAGALIDAFDDLMRCCLSQRHRGGLLGSEIKEERFTTET